MAFRQLGIAAMQAVSLLAAGCATIKFGGEPFVPRYDKEGNEVAFILDLDTPSGVDGEKANKGADLGLFVGHNVFGTAGAVVGALGGALVGAGASLISDRGKVMVKYTDFWLGYERNTRSRMPQEKIIRPNWQGSENLQKGTWARILRDREGVYLVACDPVCPAIPKPSGKFPEPTGELKVPFSPDSTLGKELAARRAYVKEKSQKDVQRGGDAALSNELSMS